MRSMSQQARLAGVLAALLLLCAAGFTFFLTPRSSVRAATTSSGFVKHSGSGLTLNGAPFRFAGANIYWLGGTGVESGVSYNQQVTSILQIVSADPPNGMSETVVRATGMGTDIGCGDSTCIEPTLNTIPQNSAAFQRMDYTIWQAGQDNIRLDIPIVLRFF
jgi:mannan endo-1,4-beta-mannosidase